MPIIHNILTPNKHNNLISLSIQLTLIHNIKIPIIKLNKIINCTNVIYYDK
jgi:hypothetical protein